jgi:hypothetical protein
MNSEVFGHIKYSSDPSIAMIGHCNIDREMLRSLLRFSEEKWKSTEQKLPKISLNKDVLTLIHALSIDHIPDYRLFNGGEMFEYVTSYFLQNRASNY